jgi:hypothetical protein
MTVATSTRKQQSSLALLALVFLLSACGTASDTIVTEEVDAADEVVEEEAPVELIYSRPTDCSTLIGEAGSVASLSPGNRTDCRTGKSEQ